MLENPAVAFAFESPASPAAALRVTGCLIRRQLRSEPGMSALTVRELAVVIRAFWTRVGGLRSQKTTEESQPPVRAKVGAPLVLYRSENQL
jgi:hypothetical protein